jgi:deoxyribonuclease V
MKVNARHGWRMTASEAIRLQKGLAGEVTRAGSIASPRLIAGADISVDRVAGTGTAAVVVLSYPELEAVEVSMVTDRIPFPYVPGLLSFREAPLVLAACERLPLTPDLLLVDGQGIAHPRRLGLAAHLGLFLEIPVVGCAKSRLCGEYTEPGNTSGDYSDLSDNGEVIGAVVRTRTGVKPLFISIGNRIDLPQAISWVLNCCRGYRLPEPTRLAHLAAGGNLQTVKSTAVVEGRQERLI